MLYCSDHENDDSEGMIKNQGQCPNLERRNLTDANNASLYIFLRKKLRQPPIKWMSVKKIKRKYNIMAMEI